MTSYWCTSQPFEAHAFDTPSFNSYTRVRCDPYALARREVERVARQREVARQLALQQQAEHDVRFIMHLLQAHRERELYREAIRHQRVAAAIAAHEAEQDEEVVRVQLPDGRRYVFPASCIREKSSQVQKEAALSSSEIPKPSLPESVRVGTESPSSDLSKLNEVSRKLQTMKRLDEIRAKFENLKSTFVKPETTNLVFPSSSDIHEPTVPQLAYNTASNRPIQEYEQHLVTVLTSLDEVTSDGLDDVREMRKALVGQVEEELEKLDQLRSSAWESQRSTSPSLAVDDQAHVTVPDIGITGTAAVAPLPSFSDSGKDVNVEVGDASPSTEVSDASLTEPNEVQTTTGEEVISERDEELASPEGAEWEVVGTEPGTPLLSL